MQSIEHFTYNPQPKEDLCVPELPIDIEIGGEKITPTHNRLTHGSAYSQGTEISFTIEEPWDVTNEALMICINGFCAAKPAYRLIREAFANNGTPTLTFSPARLVDSSKFQSYLMPEAVQTAAIIAVLQSIKEKNEINTLKRNVSGHSMGGFIAADLLMHDDIERYNSVIFVASAGLDNHNLLTLAKRAPKIVSKDLMPALPQLLRQYPKSFVGHHARHIFSNPLFTVAEGLRVANCDILERVRYIGSMGVKTAALQFRADPFFPIDEVRTRAGHVVNLFEEYPDPNAGHFTPQLDPINTARSQISMLHRMDDPEAIAA